MTTWFWIVAVLLGVTATGFVLLPLYLKPLFVKKSRKDNERDLVNVGLYEERLADLNVQLSDGGIAADEFARMLNELQRNLLDDTRDETPYETSHVDQTVSAEAARLPLVLALLVPLFAILAYADFGLSWGAIADVEIADEIRSADPHDASTKRRTLEKLAKRLEQQTGNHEGRFMLGQSYLNLSEYEKAAEIFGGLFEKFGGDASLASYYAESLFLADARKITPRVEAAIQKALALNPHELKMLEIKGMDAFQRGDLPVSLKYFSMALPAAEGQRAELIRGVIARIENQQQQTGQPVGKTKGEAALPDTGRSLQVLVELSDSVTVGADSTVFVFVKAVKGPPMPLAVQRMKASVLPALIKLDESMAMMPGMGLANFDEVQVVARISSSGIANASPDDYEARSGNIDLTLATSVIKITIRKRIKDQ
ncbi:MAG: c-type cytochrome biogenesis protein CcmI [Gammaproteobacteria bacterium]|nr:c-type cytochrome biogenesis protein CcmI [Gammaproteobacteria bacterium]